MAKGFLKGTASLNNGSDIMLLDGDIDASFVTSGSHIELDGFMTVEGIGGTIGQITLREPWDQADQTNLKFVVTYTIEGLVDAVEKSRIISEDWQRAIADVDEVIDSAVDASERLDSLEPRIDQAEQDLTTIEGTLDAKVDAAALSETNASNSASAAQTAQSNIEVIYDNFDDRSLGAKPSDPATDNDGDPLQVGANYWNTTTNSQRFYNGVIWEDPSASTTQSATSAANSATNAENSNIAAGDKVTLAENEATKAQEQAIKAEQWATYPEDTPIPDTAGLGFSAYHYSRKAESIAGGTAPDSLRLGGELPSYYAAASSVSNIDNTADIDKPISTAQKAAIDKNKIFAMAGMVM